MKVIFLDIDGVLNSNFWIKDHQREISDGKHIDPEKVKLLGKLVNKTGAEVILHSGWRFWFDSDMNPLRKEAEHLVSMLGAEGVALSGATPDLTTEEIRRTKKFSAVKADEIKLWLKSNSNKNIESWVVLDDLDLRDDEINQHQVRTNPEHGLTEAAIEKALEIL